mmetsp:Transcript_55243/g.103768  ORF Transcript_55243/g.103768 Transcript_55243/m.103768 type:complete len:142 (+) Transcript_55243:131-556(+)
MCKNYFQTSILSCFLAAFLITCCAVTGFSATVPNSAISSAVLFEDIEVLAPDASVAKLKLPASVATHLTDAVEGDPLRVSEEPWGAVRPRCLCKNLAVWDRAGLHKQILVVEPELASNKLMGKDAKAFQEAVVKMATYEQS